MSLTFAGSPVTNLEVRATISLLRLYRDRARDAFRREDRDAARRHLMFLIHVAINRKAGIPDQVGRRQDPDYQAHLRRECYEIRAHVNHRVRLWGLNGMRFQTDILQQRYGRLFEKYHDED